MNIEQRQRIVPVPQCTERCWQAPVSAVSEPQLAKVLRDAAHELIVMQEKLGARYIVARDMHVYGPLRSVAEIDVLLTGQVDEQHYYGVMDALVSGDSFGYYVINGDFEVSDTVVADQRVGALEGATT